MENSDKKILIALSRIDDYVNKRQIAQITSLNENTVHTAISRLMKNDLVSNSPSPPHYVNKLRITEPGFEIAQVLELISRHENKIEKMLAV